MSAIERLTITLPEQMAADLRAAVAGGEYASSSEVVREALRDWKAKRSLRQLELDALRADIDRGLADIEAGRVRNFDAAGIAERGRQTLATRARSG